MAMRFMPFARPTARTAAGRRNDPRDFLVRPRLAEWNPGQLTPDAFFEWRPRRIDRHVEVPAGAGEVLRELAAQRRQMRMVRGRERRLESPLEGRQLVLEHAPVGELEQAHSLVRGAGNHRTERRVDPREPNARCVGGAARRLTECFLERLPEAAVRFITGLEHRVVERLAVADALERARQAPGTAVRLEGQAISRQKIPAHAGRVDSQFAELALLDADVRLPLDPFEQPAAPIPALVRLRAAGIAGTDDSRRRARPSASRRTRRFPVSVCAPCTTAGRRCRWSGRPGRRRRRTRRPRAGTRAPSPRAMAVAEAGVAAEHARRICGPRSRALLQTSCALSSLLRNDDRHRKNDG